MDTLRLLLSPVLNTECFDKFLVDYNFTDVACLKYGLSKGLGLAIILGSLFVKVPQIGKIFKNKSAAGINFIGVLLELFAMSSSLSYSYCKGFPFSAWGEVSFMVIQTSIIAALVLKYSYSSNILPLSFFVGYAAILYGLVSDLTPIDVLWSMQALNVPIIITSRMIQAVSNYRNQSTGQLSAITVFMLFFGSTARIFSSIQETGDMVVIVTFVAASTCNAMIAIQMLYYWNSPGVSQAKGVTGKKSAVNGNKNAVSGPKKSPKKGESEKVKRN